jgi:hypothetical protein
MAHRTVRFAGAEASLVHGSARANPKTKSLKS